jgi:ParB family chromosome partitioning protein
MPKTKIQLIPVDRIHPNPDNPRYEAGDVSGLARSIEEDSLIQHLLVIPAPQFGEGHVMIEDGYCRWVAGKEVEKELPCIIRYPDQDEDLAFRALITGLITDLHKVHLKPIERAKAYGRLRDEYHMTQEQIAERCGFTVSTISRYLSLLDLSDKAQKDVHEGRLKVERALQVVQQHRARERKQEGKKPIDVGWEPDHFSTHHRLAKKAAIMCQARECSARRRLGGACGDCWETVIRADQDRVIQALLTDAGIDLPPVMLAVPITSDGGIRTNGVRGAR